MQGKSFSFKFYQFLAVVVLAVVSCVLVCTTPVFAADPPVWRILWAILPEVDYTHSDGQRIAITMTSNDLEVCERMAKRTEAFLEEAAGGVVDFQVVVKTSKKSVTSMSTADDGGLWVAERDLPADIVSDKATGGYQLTISTARLSTTAMNQLVTMHGGLTSGSYSFNMLNSLLFMDYYETAPYPELDWIHELLHGIVNHYSAKGYPMPDIHYPEDYGFPNANGFGAYGNEYFYRAFLSGNLYDNTGQQVGVTSDML